MYPCRLVRSRLKPNLKSQYSLLSFRLALFVIQLLATTVPSSWLIHPHILVPIINRSRRPFRPHKRSRFYHNEAKLRLLGSRIGERRLDM